MRVGNYELVTQLASGGMAETHIARSTTDHGIVVIKQLLPRYAGNAEFIEMFVDEGRVISSLKHPNVVAMREFGFHEELPFLALEYLHGVDLRTLTRTLTLRKKRQMPVDVALYIACAMSAGLHHAHEARTIEGKPMDITHRDVSPQNVVLTFDGEVKLIDFGIATARGRSHETRSGALKGKIPYMAPEQVRAGSTDRRTDIYATAVVLYEMLTARRPYVGKRKRMGEFSLMMAIVNHDVVPIDAIRTDIPPGLTRVLTRAMALDPDQRYQTAQELEQALRGEARRLGITLSAPRLTSVMVDVLGERKRGTDARSNAEVMQLVSEVEDAKTKVDENFDPATVEVEELRAANSGGMARLTDKGMPAFDDIVDLEAEALAMAEASRTSASGVPVDKIVEAHVTKLRFHRAIEPGFRWAKILDGIEGALEIDFSGAGDLSAMAVAAASVALHGLPSEIGDIKLVAVPIGLATQVDDRCTIISVSCAGRCPSCNQPSIAIMAYDDLRGRLLNGSDIPCARCGAGLIDIELAPLGAWVSRSSIRMAAQPHPDLLAAGEQLPFAQTAAMSAQIKVPTLSGLRNTASRAAMMVPPTHRKWMPAYIGVGVMGLAIAVGVVTLALRSQKAPPLPAAPVTTADGKSWHDPDAWRVEVTGDGVDDAAAMSAARRHAMKMFLIEIEAELPTAVRELSSAAKDELAVANFETHEVSRRLEMLATSVERKGSSSHAVTMYKVSLQAITEARAYYTRRKAAWGVELVNAPPSRAPGVLVLTAHPKSAATPGDRFVSAGGQPLTSLAALTDTLLSHDTLDLMIERVERKKLTIKSSE